MSSTVEIIVIFIGLCVQVIDGGCGESQKNGKKEKDNDCWYQLWYFWLIVGLFLAGAAVIVFFYCQQYAKNARLERRCRRRNHQMAMPPAPPDYEEPGHQPPPYHIALTESIVPEGHDTFFLCHQRLEHGEAQTAGDPVLANRPMSVPPPYSLVDQFQCNSRNNSNQHQSSNHPATTTTENSFLQLRTSNLHSYSYTTPGNNAHCSLPNCPPPIYPCWNGGQAGVQRTATDNVFHSNGTDARFAGQLGSTPMDHHVQIHQYCELPAYESRPQSGVQGAGSQPGSAVSVIESSLTTRIAVLTGRQVLEVHSCSHSNAMPNRDNTSAQGSCSRNPSNGTGSNSMVANHTRRVSVPQTQTSRNSTIRGRRSLTSGTNISTVSNSTFKRSNQRVPLSSQHNNMRQTNSVNSLASTNKQTATTGSTQRQQAPLQTTVPSTAASRARNSTNSTGRTQPQRQTSVPSNQHSTSNPSTQWSRRMSEQGLRRTQ